MTSQLITRAATPVGLLQGQDSLQNDTWAADCGVLEFAVFFLGAWMMWLVPATRRIEHLEFLVGHFQKLLRESDRAHDAAQSVLLAERMAERARYSHYSRPLLEFVSQGLLMEAGEDDRLLSCNVFPISELEKGAGLTRHVHHRT